MTDPRAALRARLDGPEPFIAADSLQHVGRAAYLRGLIERSASAAST